MSRSPWFLPMLLLAWGCAGPLPEGHAPASVSIPSPAGAPAAQPALPRGGGVLVVAHGGSAKWNAIVERALSDIRPIAPVEVGFLSHDNGPSVQDAYDLLVARGVRQVVVVPLFMSSTSGHAREVVQMSGGGPAGIGEEHDRIEVLPEFAPILGVTPSLDDHAILRAILLERSLELSRDPSSETVVLIAHGPNSDEDAQVWLAALGSVATSLRERGAFRRVVPVLLRDDAPLDVKEVARLHIREVVDAASAEGRALVVPVLLSQGYVAWQIPGLLEGLDYEWDGRTILPDDRIADWIVQSASTFWEEHGEPVVPGLATSLR